MPYIPSLYVPGPVISPFTEEAYGGWADILNQTQNTVSVNLAGFCPVKLLVPTRIRQLGVVNGSAAGGNFDLGIYDMNGTRLVSTGSTAQSGTGVVQLVDITDLDLAAGWYYFAAVSDSGTARYQRFSHVQTNFSKVLMLAQASAFPLPDPATFAQGQAVSYIAWFAIRGQQP